MDDIERATSEAWAAFDKWCRENDPDGGMSELERVKAYGRWHGTIQQTLKRVVD